MTKVLQLIPLPGSRASSRPPAAPAPLQERNRIPMSASGPAADPNRLFAAAVRGGKPVELLVDTGSQYTFLSTPHGTPDGSPMGEVSLGWEAHPVIGRPIDLHQEEAPSGRPVVGILGNDVLLDHPTLFDLEAGALRQLETFTPPNGWSQLPYENINGFLFVHATVDGLPRRLGFDTGAFRTILLGEPPRPGDQPAGTQDADGVPVTLHLGDSTLTLAGEPPVTMPVARVVSFPSLERSNAVQGIQSDGLLGVNAFGGRRFVLDPVSSSLWIEPAGSR